MLMEGNAARLKDESAGVEITSELGYGPSLMPETPTADFRDGRAARRSARPKRSPAARPTTGAGPRRSASRRRCRAACGTPWRGATGRRPSTTTLRRRPSRTCVWRGAGVRVICLARLNGLAWEISRARKLVINAFYDEVRAKALEVFALLGDGALARDDLLRGVAKNESIAQFRAELRGGQASTILAGLLDAPDQLKHALPKAVDNATWAAAVSAAATRAATFTVPLDCSRRGLSKIANETLEHVRQFHGECASSVWKSPPRRVPPTILHLKVISRR